MIQGRIGKALAGIRCFGIGHNHHGKAKLPHCFDGLLYARVGNDMPEFLVCIDPAGLIEQAVSRDPAVRHVLPDILCGFKAVHAGEEIPEELIAVIVPEVMDYLPAGCHLRSDKVKERVVHVKEKSPDRLLFQSLLHITTRLHRNLLDFPALNPDRLRQASLPYRHYFLAAVPILSLLKRAGVMEETYLVEIRLARTRWKIKELTRHYCRKSRYRGVPGTPSPTSPCMAPSHFPIRATESRLLETVAAAAKNCGAIPFMIDGWECREGMHWRRCRVLHPSLHGTFRSCAGARPDACTIYGKPECLGRDGRTRSGSMQR